jgi:hypothetical protein
MKLWIMIGEQCLTLTRSLLVSIGLLDSDGELAYNATFLCCEAPLCAELSRKAYPDHR